MKTHFHPFLRLALLLAVSACAPGIVQTPTGTPPPTPAGSVLHSVFEGITPCSSLTRPLPQIPADSDCELMIWNIMLYQDTATGAPSTYILESTYGVSQANTTGPAGGGTPISMRGTWSIATGTKSDPAAEVYQLHEEDSQVAVSLIKLSDDILHVLTRDGTLMLGNASWSYTLNRTDNQPPLPLDGLVNPGPEATRPPIPEVPPDSSVWGVFEGRSPCHEIVFEILGVTPYSGCLKLKWRLTLYQDQETGAPSTFMLMGTSSIREGTWSIVQGTKDDPSAAVYQIHLEDLKEPVSFLKADENHLFLLDRDLSPLAGNALFSYTLSRITESS